MPGRRGLRRLLSKVITAHGRRLGLGCCQLAARSCFCAPSVDREKHTRLDIAKQKGVPRLKRNCRLVGQRQCAWGGAAEALDKTLRAEGEVFAVSMGLKQVHYMDASTNSCFGQVPRFRCARGLCGMGQHRGPHSPIGLA
eukprot:355754-Chlamydomonas_euryale.AAC.20